MNPVRSPSGFRDRTFFCSSCCQSPFHDRQNFSGYFIGNSDCKFLPALFLKSFSILLRTSQMIPDKNPQLFQKPLLKSSSSPEHPRKMQPLHPIKLHQTPVGTLEDRLSKTSQNQIGNSDKGPRPSIDTLYRQYEALEKPCQSLIKPRINNCIQHSESL